MAEAPPPYHPSAVKQWVKSVSSFSSQYNSSTWSANQTIGPPKVYPQHGDIHGSWAPQVIDKHQFLELAFEISVRPTAINIYETYNAGGVVAVSCQDEAGRWIEMWRTNKPVHIKKSRIFSPPLSKDPRVKTSVIRIEIDCTGANTWCEIDAVQLVGIRDGAVMQVDDTGYIAEMRSLVNNKRFSDVVFEVDGKKIYAHKAILATRSPYFGKIFKEKSDNKSDLKFPGISYDVILAVLTYIYTNRLPTETNVQCMVAICKAASLFEMQDLKASASYKTLESISCSNVVETFQSMQGADFSDIQGICVQFMADNLKEMSNMPAFGTLPQHVLVNVVQLATAKLTLQN